MHGHSRDTPDTTTGDAVWVRSHHRAPHRAEDGQLTLPDDDEAEDEDEEQVAVEPVDPAAAVPAPGGARAGRG